MPQEAIFTDETIALPNRLVCVVPSKSMRNVVPHFGFLLSFLLHFSADP
jgi:hypothetical protein